MSVASFSSIIVKVASSDASLDEEAMARICEPLYAVGRERVGREVNCDDNGDVDEADVLTDLREGSKFASALA